MKSKNVSQKLKLAGFLLLAVGLVFLAATSVTAKSGEKFGRAETPPFPQPAENDLQKIVFIRYKPGSEKAAKVCDNDQVCDTDEKWQFCSDCQKPGGDEEPVPVESACYGFLSGSKPKWNQPEDFYFATDLSGVSLWATGLWESVVSEEIFGQGYSGDYVWGQYDGQNSISFGNYQEADVLAVTAIWYRAKNIYEYDIMFDTDYFPGQGFDLETVALHEFGHAAGLDDLYDTECVEEVMYGYLGEGEVRTDFGPGDLIGVQTLYGS